MMEQVIRQIVEERIAGMQPDKIPADTPQDEISETMEDEFVRLRPLRKKASKICRDCDAPILHEDGRIFSKQLRWDAGKLDLYEEYKCGRITRAKFITMQEKRQMEMDCLKDDLVKIEQERDELKNKEERMGKLAEDAKDIWALSEYRPEVLHLRNPFR